MTAFCLGNAQETTDTVKVIENVTTFTVSKTDDNTTVDVIYDDSDGKTKRHYKYEMKIDRDNDVEISDFPSDWGMSLPFYDKEPKRATDAKKKTKRYVVGFNHLFWGWRFNYSGKANIKNCFEVGIRDLLGIAWKRGNSEFEMGLGFAMARYLCGDGMIFVKEGDRLAMAGVEDGIRIKHSRLDMFSFQIPLLYNQKFAKICSTSIGAIVNFNTYAKASNEMEYGSITVKNECKGLHQNLLSVEPFVALQIEGFGIYASWTPMKLFDSRFGPELKSWSLGLELVF